jgi:hypothetical protein
MSVLTGSFYIDGRAGLAAIIFFFRLTLMSHEHPLQRQSGLYPLHP